MVSWAAVQVQFFSNELNLIWPLSSRKKLNWIENFNSVLNWYTALLCTNTQPETSVVTTKKKKPRVCWKRLMKQNEGESKFLLFFEGQAGTLASPASFNFYINSSFVLCYGRKKKKSLHDDHKQMVRDRQTTSATKHQRYYSFLLWQLKLGSAHQNKARDVTESWE